MENVDLIIVVFLIYLLISFFLIKTKKTFLKSAVICYIVLIIILAVDYYFGYTNIVDLYINIQHGSLSMVPIIYNSIYITFLLFTIYNISIIILLMKLIKKEKIISN